MCVFFSLFFVAHQRWLKWTRACVCERFCLFFCCCRFVFISRSRVCMCMRQLNSKLKWVVAKPSYSISIKSSVGRSISSSLFFVFFLNLFGHCDDDIMRLQLLSIHFHYRMCSGIEIWIKVSYRRRDATKKISNFCRLTHTHTFILDRKHIATPSRAEVNAHIFMFSLFVEISKHCNPPNKFLALSSAPTLLLACLSNSHCGMYAACV